MSSYAEPQDTITEPIVGILKGRALFSILFLSQLFILVAGNTLFGISSEAAVTYIILPWGIFGWYYVQGKIRLSDLEDMTYKKDPISKFIRGKEYGLEGRSLIVQATYFLMAFAIAWMAMLIFVNGGMEIGTLRQSQALGLMVYTIVMVAPSETLAFHAILPHVWARSELMPRVHPMARKAILYGSTQALFALFHAGVIFGDLSKFIFIFIAGIVFLAITEKYGIAPTVGVHAAWNLGVLGVITGGIIGV